MKKILVLFFFLFCLGGMLFVQVSNAALYKYIDKDGIISFADDLQVIPEQYRAKAVIIDGEEKIVMPAKPVVSKAEAAPSASPVAEPESGDSRQLSIRLMISGAVTLGVLLLFIVISKMPGLRENKKIIFMVRGSLIAVVSLYLVYAHVKDVTAVAGMTGQVIEDIQNKSAEKGKRAGQAIKTLNAISEETQKKSTAESDYNQ